MPLIGFTRELYFTTTTVTDWVDVFTRPLYKQIIIDSLAYCQKEKGLNIHAWVLMSNHLHMLLSASGQPGRVTCLTDILRDFKKFTSKKVMVAIEGNELESRKEWMTDRFRFAGGNDRKIKNYKFWQDGNYVEQIHSLEFCRQKINYIHQNPVKQEIVQHAEDYLYSSARDYAGGKGLLDVEIINI